MGWQGLRYLIQDRGKPDVIHAWSVEAAMAALLAAPGIPVRLTLSGVPPLSRCARIAAGWVLRKVSWLDAFSHPALESWAPLLNGLPFPVVHSVAPAWWSGTPFTRSNSRGALRTEWGVQDSDHVVWALGDDPTRIDARAFAYHIGVLALTGRSIVGVVSPSAAHLERGVRFTTRHNGAWRLLIDGRPPPAFVAACDAALAMGDESAWSSQMAEALGIPVATPSRLDRSQPMRVNRQLLAALTRVPDPG